MGGVTITQMASPSLSMCSERERLLRAFAEAMLEYNKWYAARVATLALGEDAPPIDQLTEAETQRDNAKYALLLHQEEHGCAGPSEVEQLFRSANDATD
jgi:hypothetical protein